MTKFSFYYTKSSTKSIIVGKMNLVILQKITIILYNLKKHAFSILQNLQILYS